MEGLSVGRLAKEAGVDAWTVRFYEAQGLLPKAKRSASGYRLYKPEAADRIRFIKKAQGLGLALREIRRILQLSDQGKCPCGHVEQALQGTLKELRAKIEDLKAVEGRVLKVLQAPVRKQTPGKRIICQKIEQHHEPGCCPPGPQPIRWFKRNKGKTR